MKQVIIIRKDLNMRKGKMIVQGCHSSIGAMVLGSKSTIEKWNNSGNKKICVSVDSLDELL
ncbi:MAG: aminoacyl-tRNA hydrolase, partial [Nanoarchaeota archaeon]